jgi:endonuclease/exonuclease/phosphatase (EEP) superfamily protein YafD
MASSRHVELVGAVYLDVVLLHDRASGSTAGTGGHERAPWWKRFVSIRFVGPLLAAPIGAWLLVVLLRVVERWTWRGDLVTISLPIVGVAALGGVIGAAILRWRWLTAFMVAVLLACAWCVIGPRTPISSAAPVQPIHLVAANVRFDSGTPAGGVDDLLAQHPTVLVVSELTRRTDKLLAANYPYSAVNWGSSFGEGVYSTYPLDKRTSPLGIGSQVVRVVVQAPTPFMLYAIHLPRPQVSWNGGANTATFAAQRADVLQLDHLVDAETMPTVIAGDLNLPDRSFGYRELSKDRLDVGRVGNWADTSYAGSLSWTALQLRIDYILAPSSWCAAKSGGFDITGSDHHGVVADVGTCPTRSP